MASRRVSEGSDVVPVFGSIALPQIVRQQKVSPEPQRDYLRIAAESESRLSTGFGTDKLPLVIFDMEL